MRNCSKQLTKKQKNILLIEDDQEDLDLFKSVLRQIENPYFSYKLTHVFDLKEAIDFLEEDDFDLVFCDLSLPGHRGLKTVQKVLSHTSVPLIVLTSNTDKEMAVSALHMGAQDYLVKGTNDDPDKLDRTIVYALERHMLMNSLAEAQKIALLGSWKVSKNSHLMSWSEQLYKMFRLDIEEDAATVENFIKSFETNDAVTLKKSIDESFSSGQSLKFVGKIKSEDSKPQYVQVCAECITNKKQEVLGLKGTVQDITERTILENLKDEFVGTVSHELRTPLAIIKGAVTNLRDGLVGELSEPQSKIVEIGYQNADRLGRIIDNLLDISRLESREIKPALSRLPINPIIGNLFEHFKAQAQERNIKLVLDLQKGLQDIHADADMFTQVLTNLISNAMRFAKTSITVRAVNEGADVKISVVDDGQGVPESALGAVFSKFVQIKRPQGGQGYKGTGLGLPICKEIIAGHHGKIWVESVENKGASFHILIPTYDEEQVMTMKFEESKIRAGNVGSSLSILYLSVKNIDALELSQKQKWSLFEKIETQIKTFVLKDGDLIHLSKDHKGLILYVLKDREESLGLCLQIQKEIAKMTLSDGSKFRPQIQIGVSVYPNDGTKLDELIDLAKKDISAYQSIHKVLLVDDEESLVEMISMRLESLGFYVATAYDGLQGLEKVKEFKPSVILLDIAMPNMDGWEMCKRLKADPTTKDLPIIILTAGISEEYKKKARELGANKVLPKPYKDDHLTDLLESACQGEIQ